MARFGIDTTHAYGIPPRTIKPYARELGRDHARSLELWDTGIHEARMLAIHTADPKQLTRAQADRWARSLTSWDLCDGCAIHLFRKTPFAWELAWKWARQKQEFVRRSGFALFAALAVHEKRTADEVFIELLPLIEEHAADERNFVKKAVNWALRQIGKRNPDLRTAAMETARRLAESDSASARWIGKDALRELAARPAQTYLPRLKRR
jgi:3-methyladenine DNA glycosylase AlkD